MKKSDLSLTVGITTCYGEASILDTVRSVRKSQNAGDFEFIIIADRVPIKPEIKTELKKLKVRLIENKSEQGQVRKQKQLLSLVKTDLLVLTQDDVLLDPQALAVTLKAFSVDPNLTMVSIPYRSVPPTTLFEEVIGVGTDFVNKTVRYWNHGDNYLSAVGRFMGFRTDFLRHFRFPDGVATSDAYYYFENKKLGGKFKYLSDVFVYFKNPQNMKEHLRKSSRFQYSRQEMFKYFGNLDSEYTIPISAKVRALSELFFAKPIKTVLYLGVFAYTRILKMKPSSVLNPVWEVDASTKKLTSGRSNL